MSEKLLEVKNLRVSYHTYAGEVQSVRGVSFTVNKGETVAVVGESGCGKSVTAKSIMRLIKTPLRSKRAVKLSLTARMCSSSTKSVSAPTAAARWPWCSRTRWRP